MKPKTFLTKAYRPALLLLIAAAFLPFAVSSCANKIDEHTPPSTLKTVTARSL